MVVINQQVEDDNSHGSGGSTSSADELARLNSSEETEIKKMMIRIYEETAWRMIPAVFENSNHGSGGNRSSVDEFARVYASTEAGRELMVRIYNETIRPMIFADINAKQLAFLSVVRDKFSLDLRGSTSNIGYTANTLPSNLQLRFLNEISTPVYTGKYIEGKNHTAILVALVDGISEKIVTTGPESAMGIEIVVLKGDCNDDEAKNWTSDEFNNKIVSKGKGKKVLQGNTFLSLKKGIVSVDTISFTQNSSWTVQRHYRLGARSVNAVLRSPVKQAITKMFLVRDKRNCLYNKHENPSLSDHAYRLYKISHDGSLFERLSEANIKTVMDLLTLHAINPERLKDILKVGPKTWKAIINHAQVCKDDKGMYLYPYPKGHKSDGVLFDISGQLVGIIAESQFVPCEMLPADKRADAEKLIASSSEHWEEVVSSIDKPSLLNHLQVQSHNTFNSFHNYLSINIPQTMDLHDHTNLTSPHTITSCPNYRGYVTDGLACPGQSQSPKRPASEHTFSNSPKKPRDSQFAMSPTTPNNQLEHPEEVNNWDDDFFQNFLNNLEFDSSSVGTSIGMSNTDLNNLVEHSEEVNNEDDYMQYLNDLELDKWKMVQIAVGWISVISKVRKRRTPFVHDDKLFVISASIA